MDHETFIDRLQDGDEEAYRQLFELYYSWLCHTSFSITHDSFVASSIVSDVFFRLWQDRTHLIITTSLQAYLCQAVKHASYNYLKSPSVRKEIPSSSIIIQSMEQYVANDSSDDLEMKELRKRVDEIVATLPAASRRVFLMSRQEGMTREQIAAKLGISMSTVKYHLKVALHILRDALKNYMSS